MHTARLNLREILQTDFPRLLEIYQVPNNMKYILQGRADWTMEELQAKWKAEQFDAEQKIGFQVVELLSNRQIIGEAALLKTKAGNQNEFELAYLLDEPFWGQGFGSELAKALMNFAFEELLAERLIAGMYAENIQSAKLIRKLGMQLIKEGTTRSGVSFQEFGITRSDFLTSPNI